MHSPKFSLPQYLFAAGSIKKKTQLKSVSGIKSWPAAASTEKPTGWFSSSSIIMNGSGALKTYQLVPCFLLKTLSLIQNPSLQ